MYIIYFVLYTNINFRAVSHITGFVVRTDNTNPGCILSYVAHCDPQGKLPPWLVNKVTHSLGPRMVKDLKNACRFYDLWKNKQHCHKMPWRYPEEMTGPRISITEVI